MLPGTETEFVLDYGISSLHFRQSLPKPGYAPGKILVLPDGRFLFRVTSRLFSREAKKSREVCSVPRIFRGRQKKTRRRIISALYTCAKSCGFPRYRFAPLIALISATVSTSLLVTIEPKREKFSCLIQTLI